MHTCCAEPGCGAQAEILEDFVLESTSGPSLHYKTRCIRRHVLTIRVT